MREKYQEVYGKLLTETAVIVFYKKDGTRRVMLATRNVHTVNIAHGVHLGSALMGHDKRCTIDNGNLSVIDAAIAETRSFNVGRLVSIHWQGEISSREHYQQVYEQFKQFEKEYKESEPKTLSMDALKSLEEI